MESFIESKKQLSLNILLRELFCKKMYNGGHIFFNKFICVFCRRPEVLDDEVIFTNVAGEALKEFWKGQDKVKLLFVVKN